MDSIEPSEASEAFEASEASEPSDSHLSKTRTRKRFPYRLEFLLRLAYATPTHSAGFISRLNRALVGVNASFGSPVAINYQSWSVAAQCNPVDVRSLEVHVCLCLCSAQ